MGACDESKAMVKSVKSAWLDLSIIHCILKNRVLCRIGRIECPLCPFIYQKEMIRRLSRISRAPCSGMKIRGAYFTKKRSSETMYLFFCKSHPPVMIRPFGNKDKFLPWNSYFVIWPRFLARASRSLKSFFFYFSLFDNEKMDDAYY